MPVSLRILGAAFALLAGCTSETLRSVCLSDADCGGGFECVASECVVAATAGGPRWIDAGTPLSSCDAPCGTICCGAGTECRDAACVPKCDSGVWCGPLGAQVCCGAGQRCAGQVCTDKIVEPSCPDGQQWDPQLGACAAPVTVSACVRPQTGFLDPETLWESATTDAYDEVVTTPLVIDVDGDGTADVVAPFFSEAAGYDHAAVLRALSGIDGHALWATPASADGIAGTSQLAAARLVVNGPVTIVGVDGDGRLSAYRGDTGERIWRSTAKDGSPAGCSIGWGAPAIADLDGDASPELVCGFSVFDARGVLRWSAEVEATGPLGPIVALADLDGDGRLDLTDGTRAYRYDGKPLWSVPGESGGLAAVADVATAAGAPGRDGLPEVVVARHGMLELRDGATGALRAPAYPLPTWTGTMCASDPLKLGIGGAPAVGDVDGDGIPEVVVASGECVAAMSITRGGASLQYALKWGRRAIDASSAVTGAALFDFDGDGEKDVVYADETKVHVLEGGTGAVRFEAPHCSGTIYEEPVVADVDGDGSADLVLARNGIGRDELGCDPSVKPGVAVIHERRSRAANARGIWNQHGYVVPDVCDGADSVCAALGPQWGANGRAAIAPEPVWSYVDPHDPGAPYNAARANTHGAFSANAAADAAISHLVVDADACPSALVARVRVVNQGQAPLRAGTEVRIESLTGGDQTFSTARTSRPIPPGGSEMVEVPLTWAHGASVTVNAFVDQGDGTAECDEDNNAFRLAVLACPGGEGANRGALIH